MIFQMFPIFNRVPCYFISLLKRRLEFQTPQLDVKCEMSKRRLFGAASIAQSFLLPLLGTLQLGP